MAESRDILNAIYRLSDRNECGVPFGYICEYLKIPPTDESRTPDVYARLSVLQSGGYVVRFDDPGEDNDGFWVLTTRGHREIGMEVTPQNDVQDMRDDFRKIVRAVKKVHGFTNWPPFQGNFTDYVVSLIAKMRCGEGWKSPEQKQIYYIEAFGGTPDILLEIDDLIKQATVERSHFYVGAILRKARAEIVRLRQSKGPLKSCKLQSLRGRNKPARKKKKRRK